MKTYEYQFNESLTEAVLIKPKRDTNIMKIIMQDHYVDPNDNKKEKDPEETKIPVQSQTEKALLSPMQKISIDEDEKSEATKEEKLEMMMEEEDMEETKVVGDGAEK